MAMDVVDYEIFGTDMQYVEVGARPGEAAVGEAGSMMYMQDGIEMDTIFGDGSNQQGGLFGKLLGAGKRLVTGESLFTTVFHNEGRGKKRVAFCRPLPGSHHPHGPAEAGRHADLPEGFLPLRRQGVALGIAFQRRMGAGFFGGEGFIMQKLDGDGMAFVHAGGTLVERQLAAGEVLRVDTGCVVAYTPAWTSTSSTWAKLKSALFSGEGLFFATLRGPGQVWLQSLPLSRLANRIIMSAPAAGGSSRGEGSILGGIGGLLDGDNR